MLASDVVGHDQIFAIVSIQNEKYMLNESNMNHNFNYIIPLISSHNLCLRAEGFDLLKLFMQFLIILELV